MTILAATQLIWADWIVLVGYFVIMLGIGAFFFRYMRGLKDYFVGGNAIPWWLSGVSFYMTSFSAFLFVAYSQIAYEHGLTAVVIGYMVIPAVLIGAMYFASLWRRARIDSPVEFIEERYGLGLRQTLGWANIPVRMIDNGLRLYATGVFVSGTVGLPLEKSIIYCGV
ncbi:MAG TPA: sodium transporter, partial [Phycisphaerae bacterium]|nr:sodium transporter [Phycisphaerae bacterium]